MGRPRILRFLGTPYVLFVAVCVAATALAYYSYRYANEMAQRGEQSIIDANKDVAVQRQRGVDRLIAASDEVFFNLVDVTNLKELTRLWSYIGRTSPLVESVIVLDERLHIAPDGFASKKLKADADAFRRLFERVIIQDLGLRALAIDEVEVRHLHKQYEGRYELFSYTRREVGGKWYYIVLQADIVHLIGEVFPKIFSEDESKRMVQILDERGELEFGHGFTNVPRPYLVSLPFTTLWKWRLRMAPRDVSVLMAKESAKRFNDWIFVGVASVTLFLGLGILVSALRAERRANQAKSDFIANVSHELKTPLSLISMFSEMLASGRAKDGATAREYAEIITRESERLSRLIDNVLDFARIERGKVAYEFKIGDLGEVLSRGLDVYRHRLDHEGMKLVVDMAEDLPPVRIDENAMTLALLNLVDNAVKYAADGKELRVSLREEEGRVLLAVADRGPGIPDDEKEHIFERFYRARSVRGRPERGSGIGLAIVKHIAVAHGGEVTVESTGGNGSRFTVSLPAATDVKVSAAEPEPVTT